MDPRALIFSNLLNGVPVAHVARDFGKSENEVLQTFGFVLRKIKSYAFERKMPSILASSVAEAKRYRITCLSILPKLNLDKEPKFKQIHNEIITPDNVMSVARNMNT